MMFRHRYLGVLAGLLVGMVLRWPIDRTLTLANHAGAFVASQPGATPALPKSILELVAT
jgi:sugar/nucleoside kinase (ribokinase family)